MVDAWLFVITKFKTIRLFTVIARHIYPLIISQNRPFLIVLLNVILNTMGLVFNLKLIINYTIRWQ